MKVPTSELTLLGGCGAAVLGTEILTKLSTPQQDVSRRGNKTLQRCCFSKSR
jgi:hypothetical protein